MQPYSLDLYARVEAACRKPDARQTQTAKPFSDSRTFVNTFLSLRVGSRLASPHAGQRWHGSLSRR